MAAWNNEHEISRLAEEGLGYDAKVTSLKNQYWSLLAERTGTLNNFTLDVDNVNKKATAVGFEHRGDLDNSYGKSVKEAESEIVARRYNLENKGYEAVKKQFFELPLYSTIVLFSPPPSHDMQKFGYGSDTSICLYHILPGQDDSKRTIKSLALLNKFTEEDSADVLNTLGTEKVLPTEESILLSPRGVRAQESTTGSLKTIWNNIEKQYEQQHYDFVLPPYEIVENFLLHGDKLKDKHTTLSAMIDHLAHKYARGELDQDFQKKWHIMLNLADQELLHKDETRPVSIGEKVFTYSVSQTLFEAHAHLDHKPRMVAGNCGNSGSEMDSLTKNPLKALNASTLLTTNTFEVEKGPCEECGKSSSDNHYHCPDCKKQYANETDKVERTKECNCGFKFGC